MSYEQLTILDNVQLKNPRLILGFDGWMDGGDVSTGSIDCLIDKFNAHELATIDPRDFYIYSFPGSMETAAMFRPNVKIVDGLLQNFQPPSNMFYASPEHDLILFDGREPNFNWEDFADCVYRLADVHNVSMIYFLGSVAGMVPHTREPRLYSTVSDKTLKEELRPFGVRFTDYEGPGSFVNMLFSQAESRGHQIASLVAEIPAYVQGRNVRCIESVTRRIAAILDLNVDLDDLHVMAEELEKKITQSVEENEELEELVHKLEAEYDADIFDTEMGDLKDWLEERGIRLD